jgi:soluble lytic murein transglycosylase-like protein
MVNNVFSSQIQITMFQLMSQLLERLLAEQSAEGETTTGSFSQLIEQAAEKYGVDADLIEAVIQAESNYDADAVSSAGAQGLMQLMPATAKSLGVTDAFDPVQNINGGVKLLSQLLNQYDGNVKLALAAYNAGPGAVAKYDGIPPYKETQKYVSKVLDFYQSSNDWSG